jgi:HD superfamily phosphohydrolase YqeK
MVSETPRHEKEGSDTLSPVALLNIIRSVGECADWSDDDYFMVENAYLTAAALHENDTHRGKPYVYHLLENARIVIEHFHIHDPRIIVASLFHDIVEDHPRKVLTEIGHIKEKAIPENPTERIKLGIVAIKDTTTELTSVLVDSMTNPIKRSLPKRTSLRAQKEIYLNDYIDHARIETEVPYVWMLKFADWVHNGVGIVDAEEGISLKKLASRRRKYFKLMEVLRTRFDRGDMHLILADDTIAYIEEQFRLGSERLTETGEDPAKSLGSTAIAGANRLPPTN